MTDEVSSAVEELRTFFGELEVVEVEGGGARVVIKEVYLGKQYEPSNSWIGFVVGFQYPRAEVYPHFVDGKLKRTDGKELGAGFSPQEWEKKSAIQVSRKSKAWDPLTDTAATKLAQVLEWIGSLT